jgi:BRCT domain type II-containing protein
VPVVEYESFDDVIVAIPQPSQPYSLVLPSHMVISSSSSTTSQSSASSDSNRCRKSKLFSDSVNNAQLVKSLSRPARDIPVRGAGYEPSVTGEPNYLILLND